MKKVLGIVIILLIMLVGCSNKEEVGDQFKEDTLDAIDLIESELGSVDEYLDEYYNEWFEDELTDRENSIYSRVERMVDENLYTNDKETYELLKEDIINYLNPNYVR